MTASPDALARPLGSMVAAAGIAVTVGALPLTRPQNWTADGVIQWVDHHGAPAVAAALVQAAVVVIATSVLMAGAASILAERSKLARAVADRLTSPRLVRWWAGGALVTTIAGAAPVAADGHGNVSFDAPLLHDLGPSSSPPDVPVLHDLGPVTTDEDTLVVSATSGPDIHLIDVRHSDPDSTPAAPDHLGGATWPVQHGDHLWHIAEATLRDAGVEARGEAVVQYWQQLIDANRTLVGDDVDLIHPGQVIHLPDVTAGS